MGVGESTSDGVCMLGGGVHAVPGVYLGTPAGKVRTPALKETLNLSTSSIQSEESISPNRERSHLLDCG